MLIPTLVSKDWLNANIYSVVIDDCPTLQYLCERARELSSLSNLDDRIAAMKELALVALPRNAVALRHDMDIEPRERDYYRAFVYKPTDAQKRLSYALVRGIACCRYYHSLLFILLKECGVVATAYGKFLPSGLGYTWVKAMDNHGGPVIIDLFSESLTRAGIIELDYADPTGKYQKPDVAWIFAN